MENYEKKLQELLQDEVQRNGMNSINVHRHEVCTEFIENTESRLHGQTEQCGKQPEEVKWGDTEMTGKSNEQTLRGSTNRQTR